MATVPLPTPEAIKEAPTIIKIPNTLIMDKSGNMAREWIYFFNDIGRAVDQQITANLPELTQKLLDNVADIIRLDDDAESTNLELAYAINDIATNAQNIANNSVTLTGQATSITNLNTALNNQSIQVTALLATTSNQSIEISAIQGKLLSAENTITSQADEITTLTDALAELDNRVVTLENAP